MAIKTRRTTHSALARELAIIARRAEFQRDTAAQECLYSASRILIEQDKRIELCTVALREMREEIIAIRKDVRGSKDALANAASKLSSLL